MKADKFGKIIATALSVSAKKEAVKEGSRGCPYFLYEPKQPEALKKQEK
ncbi:MAG: cyclic lactone autoinducer peptide [Butyrivibrio sp.]